MDLSIEIDRKTQKQIVECYYELGLVYEFEKEIVNNYIESIDDDDECGESLEVVDDIVDSDDMEILAEDSADDVVYKRVKTEYTFKPRFVFDIKKN